MLTISKIFLEYNP